MNIAEKELLLKKDFDDVYEAGKKSQYDEFWDSLQLNGNRVDYNMGFSSRGWSETTFKPKYDITPTAVERMFYQFNYQRAKFDLVEHLNKLGIELDFSKIKHNSLSYTFGYMNVSHLGVLDLRGITSLSNAFYNCYVEKVDKLIVNENNTYSNAFTGWSSLTDITIEGTIGKSISFAPCTKLTVKSLASIIDHLKDYFDSDYQYSYTITLSSASIKLLDDNNVLIDELHPWRTYLDNIGWNLA